MNGRKTLASLIKYCNRIPWNILIITIMIFRNTATTTVMVMTIMTTGTVMGSGITITTM